MLILPIFAFLSGIVTILSPCILPVLPIVLSGSVGGKRKPTGIVVGFIGSFSVFTLLLSTLVQVLQIPPGTLRLAAVAVITVFGLVLLFPFLQLQFEKIASRLIRQREQKNRTGFAGGLAIGTSLGLIWTPCVGPIIASVISLAISQQVDGGAFAIILAYAAGTAIPMFAIMKGGRRLIQRFPGLTRNTGKIQRGFGIVMIIAGLTIGFGLDRQLQTKILEIFPGYGSGLTSFEQTEAVQNALQARSVHDKKELSWQAPPHNGELADYGPAPEILTDGEWFNTAPLTMEELKGKVVVVDFWTYSCINCIRTLPYLKSWYETYKNQGLVILGIHSPEFAFEQNPANVQKAIADLGVTWPVVLDNSFAQWRAYDNRFWPAHYFIDAKGTIRYFHFGEGEYDTGEQIIRQLLAEAGKFVSGKAVSGEWQGISSNTPETYLGYARSKGFLSGGVLSTGKQQQYSIPEVPKNGEWGLEGRWTVNRHNIESVNSGALELGYEAKNVFLVIEPVLENGSVTVFLDGREEKTIHPDSSRMYQLIERNEPGPHLLRLEVEGTIRLYAFTFG